MRSNRKLSGLALLAVAAGLSLTACNATGSIAAGPASSSATAGQDGSSDSGADTASPSSATSGQSGSSGSGKSGGSGSSDSGSGSGSSSGSMCKTSNLSMSTQHGISGEGQEIVHLTNTGSGTCTMHGFPGVDLKSDSGSDTVSAARSNSDVPTVTLAPGEKTDFVLNYEFNNSGGSGFTFTTMIVTPPNETHSKTLGTSVNIPVDNPDQASDSAGIQVNAVGAGK
ncbi:hypothetical protein QR77_22770 [Streptomyces sp. 150FB]|uniref:DUF4232 domain-containing protein n=1 Tax=Streptomyces sp. 150FB TaxID=1576605 RepID=UPI0005895043|nr:DUF4232 domain-containing protein [Streptomyces sp. 150FB]KIF75941.1 hypothetical protein QR77_22770 [Streptomyces sp. 150FB]